jgi:hypothetical protein
MALAIPYELRSQASQHSSQVVQLVSDFNNLLSRYQFEGFSNAPLGFEFGIRSPRDAKEMPEFVAISPLTALTDIADNTQAGTLHLIPEFAVPSELREYRMGRLENVHRKMIDAKFVETCHV